MPYVIIKEPTLFKKRRRIEFKAACDRCGEIYYTTIYQYNSPDPFDVREMVNMVLKKRETEGASGKVVGDKFLCSSECVDKYFIEEERMYNEPEESIEWEQDVPVPRGWNAKNGR
jgi:hypothetical protein